MSNQFPPPPYAITAWTDSTTLFVALSGQPCVLTFALTDGGLSKALNLMRQINRQTPGPKEKLTRVANAGHLTDSQRQTASDVLRKLQMV